MENLRVVTVNPCTAVQCPMVWTKVAALVNSFLQATLAPTDSIHYIYIYRCSAKHLTVSQCTVDLGWTVWIKGAVPASNYLPATLALTDALHNKYLQIFYQTLLQWVNVQHTVWTKGAVPANNFLPATPARTDALHNISTDALPSILTVIPCTVECRCKSYSLKRSRC